MLLWERAIKARPRGEVTVSKQQHVYTQKDHYRHPVRTELMDKYREGHRVYSPIVLSPNHTKGSRC